MISPPQHMEIERRFLVKDDAFLSSHKGVEIIQGYLSVDVDKMVRVRKTPSQATLTVKSRTSSIRRRLEFEYPIPISDADQLLALPGVQYQIKKLRYELDHQGYCWEVDRFLELNAGLIIAEIELSEESDVFPSPPWLAAEITGDPRYLNVNLAQHPFKLWNQ
ncbi:MAG: CYTH domain-containing protein [FCB group bacterium]|nr:CYTH domain-containing protein [FCB group bacterium]